MKSRCVIVVPVYKRELNPFEEISLKRCAEILGNYTICLAVPNGLEISNYKKIFGPDLHVKEFEKKYFRSIASYNRLLTSLKFYKAFDEYEYMLIYQSDAYVFRDELAAWCNKGIDYIGAPIYEYDGTIAPSKFLGIGNGGFSLRKIASFIEVLTSFKRVYKTNDLVAWIKKYNLNGRIRYSFYFLRVLMGLGGNSHYWFNYTRLNEDVFWGVFVPKAFIGFKIASFEESFRFAMEYNCESLLNKNNNELPFGCHQWFKGDFLKFWRKYIPS